jgi:hypothetical protein
VLGFVISSALFIAAVLVIFAARQAARYQRPK